MIRQPVPALLQPLCIEGGLPASIARRPAATIGWQSRRPRLWCPVWGRCVRGFPDRPQL